MDRSAVFLHVCYAEDKQWWWTMFTYASIMTPLVLMHSVTGWEQSWNNEYCSKWSTVYLFQLIATCVKHGHSAKYHMWNENRGNKTAGIHTIPIHTFILFQYTHAHTHSHYSNTHMLIHSHNSNSYMLTHSQNQKALVVWIVERNLSRANCWRYSEVTWSWS